MRKNYDFSRARRGAAVASPGKTRITIMLDNEVLAHFRARGERLGTGYQTLINQALRESVPRKGFSGPTSTNQLPLTEAVLRRVLREEFQAD
jgi:hypothetical protein